MQRDEGEFDLIVVVEIFNKKNITSIFIQLPNTMEDFFAHRVRLLTLLNSGIPIITSGMDLISDTLDQEKAGMKIKDRDLAASLDLATKNPQLLKTWSTNAVKIQKVFIKNQDESSKFLSLFKKDER